MQALLFELKLSEWAEVRFVAEILVLRGWKNDLMPRFWSCKEREEIRFVVKILYYDLLPRFWSCEDWEEVRFVAQTLGFARNGKKYDLLPRWGEGLRG